MSVLRMALVGVLALAVVALLLLSILWLQRQRNALLLDEVGVAEGSPSPSIGSAVPEPSPSPPASENVVPQPNPSPDLLRDYAFERLGNQIRVKVPTASFRPHTEIPESMVLAAGNVAFELDVGGLCLFDDPSDPDGIVGIARLKEFGERLTDDTSIGSFPVLQGTSVSRVRCVSRDDYLKQDAGFDQMMKDLQARMNRNNAPGLSGSLSRLEWEMEAAACRSELQRLDELLSKKMASRYLGDATTFILTVVSRDTVDTFSNKRTIAVHTGIPILIPQGAEYVAACELWGYEWTVTGPVLTTVSVDLMKSGSGTKPTPECVVVSRSFTEPEPPPDQSVYVPGAGVSFPTVLSEFKPRYTADAMRAKIEGSVELEIVVLIDGTVGDVRVTKSLDKSFGLDDSAVETAKRWRFQPGMKNGRRVATRVGLVLEFRLH